MHSWLTSHNMDRSSSRNHFENAELNKSNCVDTHTSVWYRDCSMNIDERVLECCETDVGQTRQGRSTKLTYWQVGAAAGSLSLSGSLLFEASGFPRWIAATLCWRAFQQVQQCVSVGHPKGNTCIQVSFRTKEITIWQLSIHSLIQTSKVIPWLEQRAVNQRCLIEISS